MKTDRCYHFLVTTKTARPIHFSKESQGRHFLRKLYPSHRGASSHTELWLEAAVKPMAVVLLSKLFMRMEMLTFYVNKKR